jgi:wyosine [tRNA(Phe)-imidazoG37] synthetase (radical SAM superfamily)
MNKKNLKHIYGPVSLWRLGRTLGIELLSRETKICNFDCIYCQFAKTQTYTSEKRLYVSTQEIIETLKMLPKKQIDYITFFGKGEPTLAKNLGEVIKAIKAIRKEPVAVLTNSSLTDRDDVREDLAFADFVVVKLDAYSQESFKEINNPASEIEFSNVLSGIKSFRKEYQGRLALQITFGEENKDKVAELVYLTNYIKPDEIQIKTPLRSCSVKPLSSKDIFKIKEYLSDRCSTVFGGKRIDIISVYDTQPRKREALPISDEETLKRRRGDDY